MAERILVIGAGATGGYYGARLAEAGRDVSFLVRPRRAEALRADGLQIRSPLGDARIEPKLLSAADIASGGPPFDLVLVSVKAFALEAAIVDFAPAIGPDTLILPVLNGIAHMDVLDARFGSARVLGGVARISATLDERGRILHLARLHELIYGARPVVAATADTPDKPAPPADRVHAVDHAMRDAGFDAILSPTIEQDLWDKWVLLASLGAITCLMRGSIGQIAAAPHGVAFQRAVLDEFAGIAAALGHACAEPVLAIMRRVLTQQGSPMTASMFRDLQAGLPTEADQILGDLLARAGTVAHPAPLLTAAAAHLELHQAARNT